jgi:hypothetical protein
MDWPSALSRVPTTLASEPCLSYLDAILTFILEARSLHDIVKSIDNDADFASFVISYSSKIPVNPKEPEVQFERRPVCAETYDTKLIQLMLYQSLTQQQQQQPHSSPPLQQKFPSAVMNDGSSHSVSAPPVSRDASLPQPTFPVQSQGFGAVIQQPITLPTTTQLAETNFVRRNSQNSLPDLPRLRPVFGVPLDELLARDDCSVPIIVCQCIQAVDLYGLDVEGIYRLSGEKKHVDRIKAMFDNGACWIRLLMRNC